MRLLILFLTIILFTNIYAASYMFDNARILSLAGAGGASEALPLQYNPANLNNLNFQLIETNYIRYYNFSDLYKTSLIYGFHTQNLPIKIGLMYDKQSVYDLDQETFIFSSALKINKIYSGINLKKYDFNYQSLGEHDNSYGIDMGLIYPFEQFNVHLISR
ncbi:MAG: hypothetical protein HY934_10265, partial [Candidatus Firestonebacteria bacterium]|nr:hypothetical protein [Candidatus Firestonebacteria bacterium]